MFERTNPTPPEFVVQAAFEEVCLFFHFIFLMLLKIGMPTFVGIFMKRICLREFSLL